MCTQFQLKTCNFPMFLHSRVHGHISSWARHSMGPVTSNTEFAFHLLHIGVHTHSHTHTHAHAHAHTHTHTHTHTHLYMDTSVCGHVSFREHWVDHSLVFLNDEIRSSVSVLNSPNWVHAVHTKERQVLTRQADWSAEVLPQIQKNWKSSVSKTRNNYTLNLL